MFDIHGHLGCLKIRIFLIIQKSSKIFAYFWDRKENRPESNEACLVTTLPLSSRILFSYVVTLIMFCDLIPI
jgi:hypothetical protein